MLVNWNANWTDFYSISNWGEPIPGIDVTQFGDVRVFDAWVQSLNQKGCEVTANCQECAKPENRYEILTDFRLSGLIEKLSEHIKEGWEPLGKIEEKRGYDGSSWREVHIWRRAEKPRSAK